MSLQVGRLAHEVWLDDDLGVLLVEMSHLVGHESLLEIVLVVVCLVLHLPDVLPLVPALLLLLLPHCIHGLV